MGIKEEQDKYIEAYKLPNYRMGSSRRVSVLKCIDLILNRDYNVETHLDVSAGRGEIVDYMKAKGINSKGTEIVDSLLNSDIIFAWSHNLPFEDKSIDFITNLDAMEHYLPEQTEEILEEICRVSKKYIYFTISNRPSHLPDGRNLHINIKTYPEWEKKLSEYGKVEWLFPRDNCISENFLITL